MPGNEHIVYGELRYNVTLGRTVAWIGKAELEGGKAMYIEASAEALAEAELRAAKELERAEEAMNRVDIKQLIALKLLSMAKENWQPSVANSERTAE